jgi:hypothetical protein
MGFQYSHKITNIFGILIFGDKSRPRSLTLSLAEAHFCDNQYYSLYCRRRTSATIIRTL